MLRWGFTAFFSLKHTFHVRIFFFRKLETKSHGARPMMWFFVAKWQLQVRKFQVHLQVSRVGCFWFPVIPVERDLYSCLFLGSLWILWPMKLLVYLVKNWILVMIYKYIYSDWIIAQWCIPGSLGSNEKSPHLYENDSWYILSMKHRPAVDSVDLWLHEIQVLEMQEMHPW